MTLGTKLAMVIAAFVAILVVVILTAFRERRLARALAPDDSAGQEASDARVLAIVFSAIVGGMVLTLLAAYLLFL